VPEWLAAVPFSFLVFILFYFFDSHDGEDGELGKNGITFPINVCIRFGVQISKRIPFDMDMGMGISLGIGQTGKIFFLGWNVLSSE